MRRSLLILSLSLLVPSSGIANSLMPCTKIMLVLDQSASMAEDPDGNPPSDPAYLGVSKWEMLQDAAIEVVANYSEWAADFGLELFSTEAWNDTSRCEAAAAITVPVSCGSFGEVRRRITAARPLAETNTGEAIKRAAADPGMHVVGRNTYIILVTDGEPNCNPIDRMPEMGARYTLDQISYARFQDIKTVVVAFDRQGVKPLIFDAMADAGGTGGYYPAGRSARELGAVLGRIVALVTLSDSGGEAPNRCGDFSCFTLGCPKGQQCALDQSDSGPHCVNDPCVGKVCSGTTFCRDGACIASCLDGCPPGTVCQDGTCVEDKCAAKKCGVGHVCRATDGTCIDFPCARCLPGAVCDVATGRCVTDRCELITCPPGMNCVNNGNCEGRFTGSSGCHAAGHADRHGDTLGPVALAAALASLAMLVLRRRRRSA